MTTKEDNQIQVWETLHRLVLETLERWGVHNAFGEGDYLVVDDNYGWRRQTIEVHNLRMLNAEIVKSLQALLVDFPDWEIMVAVDIPGKEHWPSMGLMIRANDIVDDLQRKYLPEQFRFLKIPGSRPGAGRR